MVIENAVLLKIALVSAGGDHCLVGEFEGGEKRALVRRILQTDAPETAVWFCAQRLHIAAEGEDAVFDAIFAEDFHYPRRCEAFGDTAEIHFRVGGDRDCAVRDRDLFVVNVRQERR